MQTILDEVLAAVDAGTEPPPDVVAAWVHQLADPAAAAHELLVVRQRLAELRPAASRHVEQVLTSVLEQALRSVTQRAVDDALNDCVTGLPTRRLLERDCARALAAAGRVGRPVSVVMVDVDGLKKVNDTRGHGAGDDHLHAVAQALRAVVREGDGAYRVGGDEFVLLLVDADDAAAEQVLRRYSGPPISWGIATSDGAARADGSALLEAADAAMYRDRRQRRSTAPPPRAHGRGLVLAGAAAALATLGTAALVTVAAGGGARDPRPAPGVAAPPVAAPVVGTPAAPVAAPARPAAEPVAAPVAAPLPSVEVRQVLVAVPVLPPLVIPSPLPLPVVETPALPAPSPDPGAVTAVVEDTVALLEETACRLLC